MKSEYVNGIEICYSTYGSGETLILVGGFGMTMPFWNLQVQALRDHFEVLVFDNRGSGKSTIPPQPFTIADMASDTISLMDRLNLESAHVFGVSMGGMISQILCLDYPDRINKVVLGCTSHGGPNALHPDQAAMSALTQAASPDLTPEEVARILVPCLFSERFVHENPKRIEAFIRLSVENCLPVEGAAGQMGALNSFNTEERLEDIRMPVLVLTGNKDRMIPPENSRLLFEKIPGAKLKKIQGAGHNFFYEKFEELNRILKDFFLSK